MKLCTTCKCDKELCEFSKDRCRQDGLDSICKRCRKDKAQRRKTNSCTCVECGKEFFVDNYRIKSGYGFYCSHSCRCVAHNRSQGGPPRTREEWLKARDLVRYLPKGQVCEECGSTENIHRHHDDYSKPLEVRTLCSSCHRKAHFQYQPKESSNG